MNNKSSNYPTSNPPVTNTGNHIIFLYAFAFIISVIIIGIYSFSGAQYKYDKKQTYIDNLSNYDTPAPIPYTSREELYRALNSAIRNNSAKPPFYGASIREDSYQYYTLAPYIVASHFIIDIPAIEQSYYAHITWSSAENTSFNNDFQPYIELSCVPSNQNIYENFSCTEPQPYYPDRVGDPGNYLPFTQYDSDSGLALFTISESSTQNQTLDISIVTCNNNSSTIEKLKSAANAWLQESTTISLDNYKINYSTSCEGDAI